MSLVAYGASDDSEESDSDIQEEQQKAKTSETFGGTDTRKTDYELESAPFEKQDARTQPQQDNIENLLKELPAPKSHISDNFFTSNEEEELEEAVKPKASQLADAPKPPSKKKQPVKITIPALDQDSDEESSSKKRKVTSISSGKSGLTSLLPAPVHMTVKEANRVLIPHTLTKKRAPAVNSAPSSKTDEKTSNNKSVLSKGDNSLLKGLSGYTSDSDEEEEQGGQLSNFFSLSDSKMEPEVVLPQPPPSSNKLQKMNLPAPVTKHVTSSVLKSENAQMGLSSSETRLQSESISIKDKNLMSNQDEPLEFNSATQDEPLRFKSSFSSISSSYYTQNRGSHFSSQTTGQINEENGREIGTEKYQYPQYEEHVIQEDPKQRYMLDQDFLRLQGKKQRGREEINIVDVNADDFIGEVDLMKNISAETEYVSKKKEDGPTSQQKRKHQITYLAHQAKERELELKNQWSQNRMTKRQTQAKYGF